MQGSLTCHVKMPKARILVQRFRQSRSSGISESIAVDIEARQRARGVSERTSQGHGARVANTTVCVRSSTCTGVQSEKKNRCISVPSQLTPRSVRDRRINAATALAPSSPSAFTARRKE
jgi:hypothetical protein